mmetsp:Transcript_5628/g.5829  ORF Transcript_5628/g.5829 Transcript_5628/m.5829 type:complete len:103 (-) Transcript_5628:157-465(-)
MISESKSKFFAELGLRDFSSNKPQCNASHQFYGFGAFLSSTLFGLLYLYAAFISKLLPHTGYIFLDFWKNDYYYCFLIPLLILPTFVVIYLNWLCMRCFEHN